MPSAHDGPDEIIPTIEQMLSGSLAGTSAAADGHKALGVMYATVNRDEDAIGQYQKYLVIADKAARRDSEVAWVKASMASGLLQLGRTGEAIDMANQAVTLAQAVGTPSVQAYALTTQGWARLASGQVAAARDPLKRALDIRDQLREGSADRSRTRFLYAESLWPVDKRRAYGLAVAAQEDAELGLRNLPKNGFAPYIRAHQQKRIDEIKRWIAKHER
jgi:tetratricopeptide (TPR) repeat protein